MEPTNPPAYPAWWREAGFDTLAWYQSVLVTRLDAVDTRLARVRERLASDGISIRTPDLAPDRFSGELRALRAVSHVACARNVL